MAVLDVLQLGNPLLREKSKSVENFADKELKEIINNLKDTLVYIQKKEGLGRGIAAPQIGYLKRVIFLNFEGKSWAMINPKIVEKSDEKFTVWDSCFCVNLAFFVEVERYKRIKVEFQDESGNKKTMEVEGDLSELLQHEIDHLDGILVVDRISDPKRIAMRSEWEKRFAQ